MSRFANEVLALVGRDLLRARLVKTIPVAAPAVGAEWTINVPGGVIWEILAVRFVLATSAVVANRVPVLRYRDSDGNELARFPSPGNLTAGTTIVLAYTQALGDHATSSGFSASLPSPPLPLSPMMQITTTTQLIDVGDQYSGIFMVVREWDETAIIQEAQELFVGFEQYIESGYREGGDY